MNKHIQIKNVAGALHRKLKVRAVENGMSLSDYLKKELEDLADRPTNADVLAKLRNMKPVPMHLNAADLVREDRDSR